MSNTNMSICSIVHGLGGSQVEVYLFSFGRLMSIQDVVAEIGISNYQLADGEESWLFANQNPEVGKQFFIVAKRVFAFSGEGPSIIYYDAATKTFRHENVSFYGHIFSTAFRFLCKKKS